MSKKYRITLTEEQMGIAEKYIETTMRLFAGQEWMFTDELARLNCDLSPENPDHKAIFNSYIHRRDHIKEIMKAVFAIAFEPRGYLENKTGQSPAAQALTCFEAGAWKKSFLFKLN